jgi:serine/threonine protein kinase
MAPELVKEETVSRSKTGYHGPPVDVWALGVVAYELTHNRVPFRAESIQQLHLSILKCRHDKFSTSLSARGRGLIKRILTVDAAERPRACDVEDSITEMYSERP